MIVTQGLTIQGVQESVTRTIRSGGTTTRLTSLSKLQRLTSERTLIDRSIRITRKGDTITLQLNHRSRSLTTHILNRILISQPIRALHRVVCMPTPVILTHISKGSIDTSLLQQHKHTQSWPKCWRNFDKS